MSKVLILDDERQVIQQVSTLLDSFGYDYDFIPKADFLFRKLDSDDFDLILLDINMAGRDGVSLLRELKSTEQYKDIEVIMMTGETDDRILSECFELGAADYITKPIKELVLKARVKAVLDKQMYIREINTQQKLLAEKNKNITDSIKYAKRIQEAVLPHLDELNQLLPEHFILFKPRDIVSGDFYWFYAVQDRLVLAAVDCTGHGIPGAFMSMIGNICLKNIIHENPQIAANEILNELHAQVHSLLKQDATDNRDGMDMSLVIVTQSKRTLEFAGAKNPLIYFQNGNAYKIKGDKMPIGSNWKKYKDERIFTNHVIELNYPTTIYLCSDGYQDQFGGERNEKFMSKRLFKLLDEVHQKPMAEQGQILETTFSQWMTQGNESQLDDMLVIGARIDL